MPVKKNSLLSLTGLCILLACHGSMESIGENVQKKTVPPHFTLEDFYKNDTILQQKTDSLYNTLSNEERAAQLIMPATGVSKKYGLTFTQIVRLYKENIIGGVLFLKGSRKLFEEEIIKLNEISKVDKKLPLVYSCDCEPTLFHRKFTDADSMTVASALITEADVRKSAVEISAEMKKMGIQWNLAPVADIKFDSSIINERSFGANAKKVVSNSVTFIQSSLNENIATTIKHFPGHGAVIGDSHHGLIFIDSELTEVDNFQSIIKQYAPIAVMMAHIAIKNNKLYNTRDLPSSLSSKIINSLLKDSIGFNGIVITDAMSMGAVRNIPNADNLAILAGNDVVLMPQNARLLHSKIVSLMHKNNARRLQVERSVKKILRLKICLGIIR